VNTGNNKTVATTETKFNTINTSPLLDSDPLALARTVQARINEIKLDKQKHATLSLLIVREYVSGILCIQYGHMPRENSHAITARINRTVRKE